MSTDPRTAFLRGFRTEGRILGDGLHLLTPMIGFDDRDRLYSVKGNTVYRVLRFRNWRPGNESLEPISNAEPPTGAVVLPYNPKRLLAEGQSAIVATPGFNEVVEACRLSINGTRGSGETRESGDPGYYAIGGTEDDRVEQRKRLAETAYRVFDDELLAAVGDGGELGERGDAALRILEECAPAAHPEAATRIAAAAVQNRRTEIYLRLTAALAEDEKHRGAATLENTTA